MSVSVCILMVYLAISAAKKRFL